MIAVAVLVLLATPFIDKTWPSKVSSALGSPWARGVLQAMALGGVYFLGYVVGRRRRQPLAAMEVNALVSQLPAATTPSIAATRVDLTSVWSELNDEERPLLVILWHSERAFITAQQLDANRRLFHWDAQRWNGMQHCLVKEHKLLWQTQEFVRSSLTWGWQLTPQGKDLVRAVDKRGELQLPPVPLGPWQPADPY
jgi:hypothetical protein